MRPSAIHNPQPIDEEWMVESGLLTLCFKPLPTSLGLGPAGWTIFRGSGLMHLDEVEVIEYLWPDGSWRRDRFDYSMKYQAEEAMDMAGLGVPASASPLSKESTRSEVWLAIVLGVVTAIVGFMLWKYGV
jgi:hypothetical protein